jgi:hypothetical protein
MVLLYWKHELSCKQKVSLIFHVNSENNINNINYIFLSISITIQFIQVENRQINKNLKPLLCVATAKKARNYQKK